MQCQERCQRQDDGNKSEKQLAVDEVSSIYAKKVVKEKFGDQKHGRVRDLINFFEEKKMNLEDKQETIIEKMTRIVEEEAKGLEKVMVENEVYEQFNNSKKTLRALKQMNTYFIGFFRQHETNNQEKRLMKPWKKCFNRNMEKLERYLSQNS